MSKGTRKRAARGRHHRPAAASGGPSIDGPSKTIVDPGGPGRPSDEQCRCLACGACCASVGYPPFNGWELAKQTRMLKQVIQWYKVHSPRDRRTKAPCLMYDFVTGQCLIYNRRPAICRNYQEGSQRCVRDQQRFAQGLAHYRRAVLQHKTVAGASRAQMATMPAHIMEAIRRFRAADENKGAADDDNPKT